MNPLLLKYLSSVAMFAPPDDNAAAVRGSIKVDVGAVSDQEQNSEENDTNQEENENTEDENKNEDSENEDENEDNEENEEVEENREAEQTEEQKREDRKQQRIQKRIDRLTAEKREYEKKYKELLEASNSNNKSELTDEEINLRIQNAIEEDRKARQTEDVKKQFEKDCDTLRDQAIKVDKEFDRKIASTVEELGQPIPSQMIGILVDLDNENGGEVLNYLADNVDEAEDIWNLPQSKMALKLVRISDKLKEAKKPKPKERSKAPPPVSEVTGGSRASNVLPKNPTQNMDDYVRIRNEQDAAKRKTRGY